MVFAKSLSATTTIYIAVIVYYVLLNEKSNPFPKEEEERDGNMSKIFAIFPAGKIYWGIVTQVSPRRLKICGPVLHPYFRRDFIDSSFHQLL